MASIDIQPQSGPRKDALGTFLFTLHAGIGGFVILGWLIASVEMLFLYLFLLPALAAQWAVNHGSCVVNNFESWLRTGRWRDPANAEEAGFLLMLSDWMFDVRPCRLFLDRLAYSTVLLLWLLGASHLSLLLSA